MFNTAKLYQINENSDKVHLNAIIDDDTIDALDPHGIHLINEHFIHGDGDCIRTQLFLKMMGQEEPEIRLLDMTFDDFHSIEEVEV